MKVLVTEYGFVLIGTIVGAISLAMFEYAIIRFGDYLPLFVGSMTGQYVFYEIEEEDGTAHTSLTLEQIELQDCDVYEEQVKDILERIIK